MEREYFVRAGGELVPVSEEVYKAYYSHRRRERTQRERDARNRLISYDAWDNETSSGAEALISPTASPEELVTEEILREKLISCLKRLTGEERELIHALFYRGESLSAAARRLGVPRKTLEGRRDKLLKKLRIYMEAPDR